MSEKDRLVYKTKQNSRSDFLRHPDLMTSLSMQPKALALAMAVALYTGPVVAGICTLSGSYTGQQLCAGGAADTDYVNVNGVNITGVTTGHGVVSSAGDVHINITGVNSITLTGSADTAILASQGSANGTSTITVGAGAVLNIDNLSTNGITERDGLEANAAGTGYASIIHDGTGTIKVINGNAAHTRVSGIGDSTIKVTGGLNARFEASGDNHRGLSATNSGSGNAIIESNGTIVTNGVNAAAIYAGSTGGSASAVASGSVSSLGTGTSSGKDASHGVYAYSAGGAGKEAYAEFTNGTVLVKGSGTDTGQNVVAGVIARAEGSAKASVKVDNATIRMEDVSGAAGISAQGLSATSGDIQVDFLSGRIDVTNSTGTHQNADGINAYANGAGANVVVNAFGDITTAGNQISEAIIASSASGNVTVNAKGNITTTGGSATADTGNHGIMARGAVAGKTTTVTYDNINGTISTSGGGSHGITASATGGDVVVHVIAADEIKTAGDASHGIHASATGAGKIGIQVDGGTITVGGKGSHAIIVAGENDIEIESKATIVNNGYAAGGLADGINANVSNGTGYINIVAENDITLDGGVAGTGAHGIGADHGATGAGNTYIGYSNGTITTRQDEQRAIEANNYGTAGQIVVENSGTIQTAGDQATGITANIVNAANSDIVKIVNFGNVSTQGNSATIDALIGSHALAASSAGTGKISIGNSGILSTQGKWAYGMVAQSKGGGDIELVNIGNIDTAGASSHAIWASNTAAGAGGDIVITTTDNDLHTQGSGAAGIRASVGDTATSGDIEVNFVGGSITTDGDNADGIWTSVSGVSNSSSNTVINASGTITTTAANSAANTAFGIVDIHDAGTTGNVLINYTGDKIETGLNQGSDGIRIAQRGSGTATIVNTGEIVTHGRNATGIRITDASNTSKITSTGKVTTDDGHGIWIQNVSGEATIIASNDVTTGQATANTHNHGIEAGTNANGKASVYYDNGTVKVVGSTAGGGNSIGLVSWDNGTDNTSVDGYIYLGSNGVVDASQGVGGMQMRISGTGVIDIDQGAQVHGGANNGYGINLRGVGAATNHTVNNLGTVDAMNDRAIKGDSTAGTVTIENHGTITGYASFTNGSNVLFNNWSPNSFDIRNFADTDGDGIRDTKAVSVSTFGGLGSTFVNQDNGVVRLLPVSGETTTVTTGQYLSDGLGIYDTARSGVVQGQLLDLGRFENRGLIDLTGSGNTGDTLVISGGTTVGTNGGGTYVSEGGTVKMDVVVNQGDTLTEADLLVVDNVALGSAPTVLQLNTVKGAVGLTKPDGIKLVDVMGTSDAGAFVLASAVENGPFEYLLFDGARSNANNRSWYLRNVDENGRPIFRAKVGSYLANQTAATGLFMHTLHDRLGEPQFTEAYKNGDDKVGAGWVRVVGNHTDSKAGEGTLDQDTDSYLIHFGGDIAQWTNGTDRLHLGLMGAYGESETDTTVQRTRKTSTGKVTGYSVGAYATWYRNKDMPTGLYLDGWLQYGWFDNKVNAPGERSESYDSEVFTASLEAGYAFIARDGDKRQWMIEPQAQIAYNEYSSDDHIDATGMKVSGNDASGVVARLGARMYSRSKLGDNGIQPFVEANWWYGSANNSLKFDGYEVKDDTPENRFEAKLGLQGEIAKGWQMWGHIGGMWGDDSYERYEGMIGLKKLF